MPGKASMCSWFSIFFENPFVSRVSRLTLIRIVRFWRSTKDMEMCLKPGLQPSRIFKLTHHQILRLFVLRPLMHYFLPHAG